jgi:hypothetical protein
MPIPNGPPTMVLKKIQITSSDIFYTHGSPKKLKESVLILHPRSQIFITAGFFTGSK